MTTSCYKRARKGFVHLLGEDSAKAVAVAYYIAGTKCGNSDHYRPLWEMAKVSLPDETITFDIGNQLGGTLIQEGKYEKAKAVLLAAAEWRRLLGEEHKKTLIALMNTGSLLSGTGENEGALECYQQAHRGEERLFGKAHPQSLGTILNLGSAYKELKNFKKAEEMYRFALDDFEKSLGKDHEETKLSEKALLVLIQQQGRMMDASSW